MNVPRRRGPIARVLVGAWDAMNFTRRLVFNLLFFFLLLLLVVALASGDRIKPLISSAPRWCSHPGARSSSSAATRSAARSPTAWAAAWASASCATCCRTRCRGTTHASSACCCAPTADFYGTPDPRGRPAIAGWARGRQEGGRVRQLLRAVAVRMAAEARRGLPRPAGRAAAEQARPLPPSTTAKACRTAGRRVPRVQGRRYKSAVEPLARRRVAGCQGGRPVLENDVWQRFLGDVGKAWAWHPPRR